MPNVTKKFLKNVYKIYITNQEDNAKRYTAKSILDFLARNVPHCVEKLNWPANSSDLNPLNYSVWSVLNELKYKSGHNITDVAGLECAVKC